MRDDPVAIIHQALEVLELPPMVTYKEIKEQYKKLSKIYHPDSGGDEQKMARINEAFNILKNYVENYRFSFTEEEILKQFPFNQYQKKFRF